jgi:TolA-binding protein
MPLASAEPPAASSAGPTEPIAAPTIAPVAPDPPEETAFAPPASTPELDRARDRRLVKGPFKPTADDAPYFAAIDEERAGDRAKAREHYLAIVRATPPSRVVGYAYFGLGEIYLAEAAQDASKLELAAAAFEKAVATLPAKSALAPFAAERQTLTVAAIRSRRATRAGP